MSRPTLFPVLVLSLLVAACSGPSQSQPQGSGPAPGGGEETAPGGAPRAAVTEYETFDVSDYPVRPPDRTVEVVHQAPTRLMRGRADEGITQTVEGFRVQVFSAQDQEAARDFREKVRQWWASVRDEAPEDVFRQGPPIVIEYSQPYYRVRIGAFAEREEATEALEFVSEEYSGAFVARSTVTVVQ
jgi:hypothetical protein